MPSKCPDREAWADKQKRIDLGLDVARVHARDYGAMTTHELAAFCDCTPQAISQIELKALRKLRRAVMTKRGIGLTVDDLRSLSGSGVGK